MKFLIVANGPFLHKSIIAEIAKDKLVVALDGASNRLAALGIKPDVILGDFDSISETSVQQNHWGITTTKNLMEDKDRAYEGRFQTKIVPAKNQNLTDLQKAIHYCDENNAVSIEIVCATGGSRMDHHESNVRTLRRVYSPTRVIYIHTESQSLQFVKDGKVKIKGAIKDYCGILAAPDCQFIAEDNGLAWSKNENGSAYKLKYAYFDSTSNELAKEEAEVTIAGEALIIHPGMYSSQRKFTQLTEQEQLKSLCAQAQFRLIETTVGQLKNFKAAYKLAKTNNNNYFCPKKLKLKPGIMYVTTPKEHIDKLGEETSILLSLNDNKYNQFLLFKKHFNNHAINQQTFEHELKEKYTSGEIKFYKKSS